MKMPCLAAQIVVASFGFALMACAGTPRERQATHERGYRTPPCSAVLTHGTPCTQTVVRPVTSACEKRFGKICRQGDQ